MVILTQDCFTDRCLVGLTGLWNHTPLNSNLLEKFQNLQFCTIKKLKQQWKTLYLHFWMRKENIRRSNWGLDWGTPLTQSSVVMLLQITCVIFFQINRCFHNAAYIWQTFLRICWAASKPSTGSSSTSFWEFKTKLQVNGDTAAPSTNKWTCFVILLFGRKNTMFSV